MNLFVFGGCMGASGLTDYTLICLENAVANGAKTNAEMAQALGWSESKFRNIKDGDRKNGAEESARISQYIRNGENRQMDVFLALAENSLRKLVVGYEYEEVTEESGLNEKGEFSKKKTTKKQIKPDANAVMFTLVNSGKGRWRSINSPVEREETQGKLSESTEITLE